MQLLSVRPSVRLFQLLNRVTFDLDFLLVYGRDHSSHGMKVKDRDQG